jgi:CheY-like chemotaxis protein
MPNRTESDPSRGDGPSPQLTGNSFEPAFDATQPGGLARHATPHVLVADDNPVNAILARHLLESLGCKVDIATSGELALAMQADHCYGLIIMDCLMDGLDGFAATQRLRAAEPDHKRTPVVGWTSDAEGQRARCIDSGMDDVLQKPVSKEALARVLARWSGPEPGARRTGGSGDSSAAPPQASVDKELRALQELFGDAFEEVANIYTAETPRRLAALDACLAAGDHVNAGRLAHALAGSSASIGARSVSQHCRTLEMACRDGVPSACQALRDRIDRAYTDFNERLTDAVAASRG